MMNNSQESRNFGSYEGGDYQQPGPFMQNESGPEKLKSIYRPPYYAAGFEHSGAFASKPAGAQYVWEVGDVNDGVLYTAAQAAADEYQPLSLSREVHEQVDNPYWSDPAPIGYFDESGFVNQKQGYGLFQGVHLPDGVDSVFDFDYDYDTENASITHQYYALDNNTKTGHEGTIGRIKLNDLQIGDQLRVRFEFNVIPQHANTTVTPALWYSNRNADDEITFTFALTTAPLFFGSDTQGKQFDNRVEISAWIVSEEDLNALVIPAFKSTNEVIIQPVGMLVTIIR